MKDSTRVKKSGLVLATERDIVGALTDRLHISGILDVQSYHSVLFGSKRLRDYGSQKEQILASIINAGNEGNPFYVSLAYPKDFIGGISWEHLDPPPRSPLILYENGRFRLVNPGVYSPSGEELNFYKKLLENLGIRLP